MFHGIRKLLQNESGATAIEYGLIAALIVVVIIAGIAALGSAVSTTLYDKIATAL